MAGDILPPSTSPLAGGAGSGAKTAGHSAPPAPPRLAAYGGFRSLFTRARGGRRSLPVALLTRSLEPVGRPPVGRGRPTAMGSGAPRLKSFASPLRLSTSLWR